MVKHAQIEAHLAGQIVSGAMAPGERLPPERHLAQAHGVSRMTVRQALGALADRGLIERGVGRGTFVADPRVRHDLSRVAGFSDVLRRQGLVPGARVRSVRLVSGPPPPLEGGAWRIRRLRTGDGVPLALEDSWVPADLVPDLDGRELTGSLYALLRDAYGLEPERATEALEPAVATAAEARLLGIPAGSALMVVERVTYAAGDRPIEAARDVFRGDRARFVVETSSHPPRVLAGV
jgi:GntR family transcriptional regulator